MSGRIGRDRSRREPYPSSSSALPSSSRFDDRNSKSFSSRGKNPPSRHLWVGNLPHHISQSTLTDHFIRFGELESIAFAPGRSYAFVNFFREDDAFAALNSLQGFSLDGSPLRIEFAKAEKASAQLRDEDYVQHRDELHPPSRSSGFSHRESRGRHGSPDAFLPDGSRTGDHGSDHPSEILWIGFPSFLKVDETILRKAFSPFGEIEKITAFPGRTYAFVQFRNLASACRAKETLQGKLFGNPRVHICFARNDTTSSTGGRRGVGPNAPLPPHLKPNDRAGSSDNFWPERNFGSTRDPSIRSPHFSNMGYEEPDIMSFGRKEPSWTRGNGAYDERRFHEIGQDVGLPQNLQGYRHSPTGDGNGRVREFSHKLPRKSPFPEDPWDSPDDAFSYHGAKKLKTGPFPHEKELPEYPFHSSEQGKHALPRMVPDLPLSDESGPFPYKQLSDLPMSLNQPLGDRHDSWRSSRDTFLSPPRPLSSIPDEWKRNNPELHRPARKEEWKWEGTIAKGGTPVCRARCFPVGKVMDIFLPEFLDCTARTGLDMLAKHYYQASGSWVVFFVPASDADMGYYNEFMHYLEEKQRAAVAKLDEKNTLFLVPPSDFSEKVLKVPGKLSISGVVLRIEPASPTVASHPSANEMRDTNLVYSNVDRSYHKSESPSGPYHPLTSYPNLGKPGITTPSLQGSITTSAPSLLPGYGHAGGSMSDHLETRHEHRPSHRASPRGPTWSPQPPQTSSVPSSRDSMSQAFAVGQEYHLAVAGRGGPEPNTVSYKSSYSGMSPLVQGGPQTEQHPELQSSLLGLLRQATGSSSVSTGQEFRPSGLTGNQLENLAKGPPGYNGPPTNQVAFDHPTSQLSQVQQQLENTQALLRAGATGSRGNQEVQSVGGAQDDGEADPQKRLQATLQLAAALLQQIQQGKGT